MINNKCVYYETSVYNYEEAKQKCEKRFNNNGRLFEPKSWYENELAYKSFSKNNYWIGINDKQNEGHFVFEGDGTNISYSPIWYSNYGTKGKTNNCIEYASGVTTAKWLDYTCSASRSSICEQKT